jgi:glycosyltransferase involved in cell wall biosynthesis
MDSQIKFSVVLPTYNRAHHLPQAIESVLGQTYADWELLVVDDGSTDDTETVVRGYQDARIRYLSRENGGPGAARNTGLEAATGDYIAFLDSDDAYLPHHLATFAQQIGQAADHPAVYHAYILYETPDGKQRKQPIVRTHESRPHLYLMLDAGMFPTSTVIHREIGKRIRCNDQIPISIDAEYWLRVFCYYPLVVIPEYVGIIKEHDGNLTTSKPETYRRYVMVWRGILRNKEIRKYLPARYITRHIARNYIYLAFAESKQQNYAQVIKGLHGAFRLWPASLRSAAVWKTYFKAWLGIFRLGVFHAF